MFREKVDQRPGDAPIDRISIKIIVRLVSVLTLHSLTSQIKYFRKEKKKLLCDTCINSTVQFPITTITTIAYHQTATDPSEPLQTPSNEKKMVKMIALLLACVVALLAAPAPSTKPSLTLDSIAHFAKNYTRTLPVKLLNETYVEDLSQGETKRCSQMTKEGFFCRAEGILAKLNNEKLEHLVGHLEVLNQQTHKKGECQKKALKKHTNVNNVLLRAFLETLLRCVQYTNLSSPTTTTNKP